MPPLWWDFTLLRPGCRARLGPEGRREGRRDRGERKRSLFSQSCGGVREGRGKDEEAVRGREEPTPFYQRREREALP